MQNITDYLLLNGFSKIGSAYIKGDHAVTIAKNEVQCYRKDGDTYLRYLVYETMDMEHADVMFFFHAIGVVPLKTVVHKVRDLKAFSKLN